MTQPRDLLPSLGLNRGASYPKEISVIRNAHWYDHAGTRLGSSDMKIGQPQEVAQNLEIGEMLIVVPSHEATQLSSSATNGEQPRERARDLAAKFSMLIVPRCIYLPGLDAGYSDFKGMFEAPTLSPKSASNMIHSVQRLARFIANQQH